MTLLDLMMEARRKLENKSGWCQGHMALDKSGNPVSSTDPSAVSWSVIGALYATDLQTVPWEFIYQDIPFLAVTALAEIVKRRYLDSPYQGHMSSLLSRWNNIASHMEILNVFDEAIRGIEQCSKKRLAV